MSECPICYKNIELQIPNFYSYFHMPICYNCIEKLVNLDETEKHNTYDLLRSAQITITWEQDYHEDTKFLYQIKLRREKLFNKVNTILYG